MVQDCMMHLTELLCVSSLSGRSMKELGAVDYSLSRGFAHREFERPNQFNGTTPVKRCNRLLMKVFYIHVSSTYMIQQYTII